MPELGLEADPVGSEETRKVLGSVDVNTSKVHVADSNHEELIPEGQINVTVGVFFDGTLNNRSNVQSRVAYEQAAKPFERGVEIDWDKIDHFISDPDKDTSFYNDESNVSRLEPYYEEIDEKKEKVYRIYVEGIGTEDFKEDSFLGFALGEGATGVRGKVKIGCEKVADKIKKAGKKKISVLTIDTYGFSRGAAAARNFIHEIKKKKGEIKQIITGGAYSPPTIIYYNQNNGFLGEHLAAAGISFKMLVVRFVGLYDTVPSVGLPFNHKHNAPQLGLDAVKHANHVVHLTAMDEHRSNFSLFNIDSAGNKGIELQLPGVHSDIGGGYVDNASEKVKLEGSWFIKPLETERQRLINEGWYRSNQITIDKFWGTLWGEKAAISNKYSFIPLHMMCHFSIHKGKVKFKLKNLLEAYKIDDSHPKLVASKIRLFEYAFGKAKKLDFNNPFDRMYLRGLRLDYFHFSAHFGGISNSMKPNYKKGVRTRNVYSDV